MSEDNQRKGENLIFLISQPRAGSTLTQKILGNHPSVYTTSEPWLLLHPLYVFRKAEYKADYNNDHAVSGLESFLDTLPDHKQAYFNAIATGYSQLYAQALDKHQKHYFLDKTPRYYNIISEIHHVFPEANFILLFRNPLAVLCSIINTWIGTNWLGLKNYKNDLLKAPLLLVEGMNNLGEKAIILHYERILKSPEDSFKMTLERMGLEFFPNLLHYGNRDEIKWDMGDQISVHKHSYPNSQNLNCWTSSLESPQIWRLASEYLDFLGPKTLKLMGYSYDELRLCLNKYYPGRFSLWNTLPLSWLTQDSKDFSSFNYGYYPVRLMNAIQRKGIWGTGTEGIRKLFKPS
ncbi:sulfotransferase family protein [Nodosilinea sp. AN01ver1]|uniref:sulfotransferase family protein n=1 Tax=Nodosilinea sp. AN01ver1 TaxID=3423362 RepID=UPI003D31A2B3